MTEDEATAISLALQRLADGERPEKARASAWVAAARREATLREADAAGSWG